MAEFKLEVVSPEGGVLNEQVEFAVLPGIDGEIGILANHSPLISALKIGIIRYTQDGKVKKIAASGGFVEVAENKVVILADTAELGETIDLQRAISAQERAAQRLKEINQDIDHQRAEVALKRAVNRINAAEKH